MKIFLNKAALAAATLTAGQLVETKGYYTAGDGGQARYLIKTAADYGATPDEYGDHTLANGNIAVLQYCGLSGYGQLNLAHYGCINSGSDVASNVQAAINKAWPNNVKIYAPEATYQLDSTISVPYTTSTLGLSLLGDGAEKTVFNGANITSGYVFDIGGGDSTANSMRRGQLSGFQVQGGDFLDGGIRLQWVYSWEIDNIYIRDFTKATAIGIDIQDSFNVLLTTTQANLTDATTKTGTGFKVSSTVGGQNVTQIKFDNCLSQYNDIGFLFDFVVSSDGITLENSAVGKCNTGVNVSGFLYNLSIQRLHLELLTTGIEMVGTIRGSSICENLFYGTTGASMSAIVIDGSTGTIDRIGIKRNTFLGNSSGHKAYTLTSCSVVLEDNIKFSSFFTVQDTSSGAQINNQGQSTTVAKYISYSISPFEDGFSFTNEGSTTPITFTLPPIADISNNFEISIASRAGQSIIIEPYELDKIQLLTNANGDSITSDGTANTMIILKVIDDRWFPTTFYGVWSDSN